MPDDFPSDIFDADIKAIEDRGPVTVTLTREDQSTVTGITATLSLISNQQVDISAGWLAKFAGKLIVRVSILPETLPTRAESFTVTASPGNLQNGKQFAIDSFDTDDSGVSIIYTLRSMTQ